jgi:hypothetical protein
MTYIQRKDQHGLETVDEFVSRTEALSMAVEYAISDPYADYYTSSRACKDWREAS